MTTIAPIDIEKPEEAAVLIDYENIRLGWEKCYSRLFTYTDLCWLCELTEHHFKRVVGRIVVFMSNPDECEETCCLEQLDEMKDTLKYLKADQARSESLSIQQQPVAAASLSSSTSEKNQQPKSNSVVGGENDSLRRKRCGAGVHVTRQLLDKGRKKRRKLARSDDEIVDLLSDNEGEDSSISGGQNDSHDVNKQTDDQRIDSDSDLSCDLSNQNDIEITSVVLHGDRQELNSSNVDFNESLIRLGINACPKAEIFVKVFSYKMQRNMRVQRGCDVQIGVEVTKICFMPFFNSIFLFSADSDFEMTTRQCSKAEIYGGIIKYAKPICVLGFSRSFDRERFLRAREENYDRKNNWGRTRGRHQNYITENQSGVFFIDYEFNRTIRKVLAQSNRPFLPPSAFQRWNKRRPQQPSDSASASELHQSDAPSKIMNNNSIPCPPIPPSVKILSITPPSLTPSPDSSLVPSLHSSLSAPIPQLSQLSPPLSHLRGDSPSPSSNVVHVETPNDPPPIVGVPFYDATIQSSYTSIPDVDRESLCLHYPTHLFSYTANSHLSESYHHRRPLCHISSKRSRSKNRQSNIHWNKKSIVNSHTFNFDNDHNTPWLDTTIPSSMQSSSAPVLHHSKYYENFQVRGKKRKLFASDQQSAKTAKTSIAVDIGNLSEISSDESKDEETRKHDLYKTSIHT